jgi:hypothetical protein
MQVHTLTLTVSGGIGRGRAGLFRFLEELFRLFQLV